MRYFLILILMIFPSIVFAQIKVGVFPVEFKGENIPFSLKEEIENTIYKNLNTPFQIEVITLNEKISKNYSQLDYFLRSNIEFLKDKVKIELILLDPLSLKPVYSIKENIASHELLSKLSIHCKEIKNKVLSSDNLRSISFSENKSFFSKINPFSAIGSLFSKLFSKEEKFDIRIPIPPPPPPPGYHTEFPSPKKDYKHSEPYPSPKAYHKENEVTSSPSPWQWF